MTKGFKMEHVDISAESFENGYNCAQSVLLAYCKELGLDENNAAKVAAGFGGGMRIASVCGALTGAYMVIGLNSSSDPKDKQNKQLTIEKIKKMTELFIEANGSTSCRELLGCDVSTADGMKHAQEHDLIKKTCPGLVKSAATLLKQVI